MSDPNIFNDNSQNQPTQAVQNNQVNTAPNNTGLETLLQEIKNERGEPKYRTVQDALYALKHSQEYIPSLKRELETRDSELASLRKETEKISTLEQSIQELLKTPAQPEVQPQLDEERLAALVSSVLEKKQAASTGAANQQAVVAKFTERFGEKANETFYSMAAELGMSAQEVNALAAKSPQAVFKMMGLDTAPATPRYTPAGGVNTTGLAPKVDSAIGRNTKTIMLGATTNDLRQEVGNARSLVDELHSQGLSTYDLTDPKVFSKYFS